MPDTLLLHDDTMIEHDPGPGHPERSERLEAIVAALRARPVAGTRIATPRPAPREAITRVHHEDYVARVDAARGQSERFDPDTVASPRSVEAAYLAAGAALDAVDAVLDQQAKNAFALCRPPGHHAVPAGAMGFCFFNNVAIAAEHALLRPEVERVLIVDWDVHHGNGTQDMFYGRNDVLFVSTHQSPLYPGTGALPESGTAAGEGFTVNVPIGANATDADYRRIFSDVVAPAAEKFDPDLVLVSAGFDAHRLDPVGGMAMTAEGYADLCNSLRAIAATHAQARLVLLLEGGYDLDGLAQSAHACVEILAGGSGPGGPDAPTATGEAALRRATSHHRRYWPV